MQQEALAEVDSQLLHLVQHGGLRHVLGDGADAHQIRQFHKTADRQRIHPVPHHAADELPIDFEEVDLQVLQVGEGGGHSGAEVVQCDPYVERPEFVDERAGRAHRRRGCTLRDLQAQPLPHIVGGRPDHLEGLGVEGGITDRSGGQVDGQQPYRRQIRVPVHQVQDPAQHPAVNPGRQIEPFCCRKEVTGVR